MKKLLLFLLLVACSFVVAQAAIPAPDRDVGMNVEYVMPSIQINQVFVVNAVPVMQTLYLDTGRSQIQTMQPNTKQLEQCLMPVIPHYKGPQFSSCVNNPTTYTETNFT